jgi:ligand-binding sensor protein
MKITDFLSKDDWKKIEEEFHQKTGLDTNVYDPDGFTFTGLKQWANKICPVIKAKPESLQAVCSVAHQNMAHQARQTGRPVIEECDIGLVKICVPVMLGDDFIGAIGGCGLLLEGGEVETFMVHKLTGMDESRVEELAAGINTISEAQAMQVAEEMEAEVNQYIQGAN